jgi:hypothetical protein
LAAGRLAGPVILLDPPSRPVNNPRNWIDPVAVAPLLQEQTRRNLLQHAANPENDMPFDIHDPEQLNAAILRGSAAIVAIGRHVPTPYAGPVEMIVNGAVAARFVHPELPWMKILAGPCRMRVVPGRHTDLFGARRHDAVRHVCSALDQALVAETPVRSAAGGP